MKYLLSFLLLLITYEAQADEVFKWIDSKGHVYFSTKKLNPNDKPVKLPKIKKENFDLKIKRLKQTVSKTCDKNGGIDCKKGSDKDGSVICHDGYRDAEIKYKNYCEETNLSGELFAINWQNKRINLSKKNYSKSDTENIIGFELYLRNEKPVLAKKVNVSLFLPNKSEIILLGKDSIKGFSVGIYKNSTSDNLPMTQYVLDNCKINVQCQNCTKVLVPGIQNISK